MLITLLISYLLYLWSLFYGSTNPSIMLGWLIVHFMMELIQIIMEIRFQTY